ncbi:chlorophyll a/b-binding protein [Anabaena azotica]|uniref:High light inducible protein n=1 Tax=Anabaena azotica FACHB-119 TaxID=947527 RepID=A0ABR8D928_9NOST|nr:chlorophyll a/b-binding protein [Anabaena azotica]MBD2503081.1 high light inducible protein [Anabaena azotica FACHB-119]
MRTNNAIVDDQGLMNNFAIEPKVYVDEQGDRTGFTPYAEVLNGRLAMIGFISLIALEVFTGKGIFGLLAALQ